MCIWSVIILPILSVLGALLIASFLTPAIIIGLEKLAEYFTHKPQNETNKREYRIYIPYPIQYIRHLLNFQNYKGRIVKSNSIEHLHNCQRQPRPYNTNDMVRGPSPKFHKHPIDDGVRKSNVSGRATKSKQNRVKREETLSHSRKVVSQQSDNYTEEHE